MAARVRRSTISAWITYGVRNRLVEMNESSGRKGTAGCTYPSFLPCFFSVSEPEMPCWDMLGLAVSKDVDPRRIDVFLRFSARLERNEDEISEVVRSMVYSCRDRRIIVPRLVAYESIKPCRKPCELNHSMMLRNVAKSASVQTKSNDPSTDHLSSH